MDASIAAGGSTRRDRLARMASAYGQELVVLGALVVLMAVVGVVNPRYLASYNLNSIFAGNAYIAVAAIGQSMVIITGNIDVSVGALIGVLGTVSGTLAVKGYPVWVAWGAAVLLGVLAEAAVGALVAYARIPAIVVTLGMLSIFRGGLITFTGGRWITPPAAFRLAQERFFNVPAPVYLAALLTVLAALWMKYSAPGRSIYAVGGNAEAARAAGIRTRGTVVMVFALNGFFAGIAAVLFATQLQVIQSTVPPNLELSIITAAVIGGVSILGGTGTVVGSTLAALLFSAIASALIFVNVSAYWLRAVLGLLILVTVLADMARRQRKGRLAP